MKPTSIENGSFAGETAGEIAFRQIRRDVILGTLAPGSRLPLERLKDAYLVSVSTLREIFNRLASEGFVVAEGQRGFRVSPISQEHFQEVAGIRELLEAHALRRSFEQGDLEWESEVVAAHHKLARMEAMMNSGERSQTEVWKRYDREFHAALISACGSKALLETYRRIFDHFMRYQIIAIIYRGRAASEEHKQLLDCALSRDSETAVRVLERHIRGCVDHTLENRLIEA